MGYARDFVGAMESVLPAVADARRARHRQRRRRESRRPAPRPFAPWPPRPAWPTRCASASSPATTCCRGSTSCSPTGTRCANMETGEPLSTVRDRVLSANAYIGSVPIVEALRRGRERRHHRPLHRHGAHHGAAALRVRLGAPTTGTGSPPASSPATSSSAARSARAATACTTGGPFPTWPTSATRSSRRRPTARSSSPSTPDTGGRIYVPSVTEQLVYEMGDPHAYITPDVVADFTSIHLEQAGDESRARVRHRGPARHRQAQGVDRLPRRVQGRRLARLCLARRAREGAAGRSRAARAPRPPRPPVRPGAHRVRRRLGHARAAGRRRRQRRPGGAVPHRRARRRQRDASSGSRARSCRSCSTGRRA